MAILYDIIFYDFYSKNHGFKMNNWTILTVWDIAITVYLFIASVSFVPTLIAILKKVQLNPDGDGYDKSLVEQYLDGDECASYAGEFKQVGLLNVLNNIPPIYRIEIDG